MNITTNYQPCMNVSHEVISSSLTRPMEFATIMEPLKAKLERRGSLTNIICRKTRECALVDCLKSSESTHAESKIRGCMKVLTLEDSLKSCDRQCRERRGSLKHIIERRKRAVFKRMASFKRTSLLTTSEEWTAAKKKVKFGNLQVRKFSKTALDDNPAVSSGAAIALGGGFTDFAPASVDSFELLRGKRMNITDMRLSDKERLRRLLASGYEMTEIQKSIIYTRKIQATRAKTARNVNYVDVVESMFFRFKELSRLRKDENNQQTEIDDTSKAAKSTKVAKSA